MKIVKLFLLLPYVAICLHFVAGNLFSQDVSAPPVNQELLNEGKPGQLALQQLLGTLAEKDARLREAAIRRLAEYPEVAGEEVLKKFFTDRLAVRLAASEILTQWNLPTLERFDPWRQKETFTDANRVALEKDFQAFLKKREAGTETAQPAGDQDAKEPQFSAEQISREIDQMLETPNDAEVTAICERLYRAGEPVLTEARKRLSESLSTRDHTRLTLLRYRLASSVNLPLRWPGGLERLASNDEKLRREAAEQFVQFAGNDDLGLLVELFANPDALVREIALQALQRLGSTDALNALAQLLNDPEPNVRAAVLKIGAEKPTRRFATKVVEFVAKEKDPDLLVHGIRVIGAAPPKQSIPVLLVMLKHEQWQVRAEAAQVLAPLCSELVSGESSSHVIMDPFGGSHVSASDDISKWKSEEKTQYATDVVKALIECLDDEEPFVVAKSLEGFDSIDMPIIIDPLIQALEKHPELANDIVETLASNTNLYKKSKEHFDKLIEHKDAKVRAAVLQSIASDSLENLRNGERYHRRGYSGYENYLATRPQKEKELSELLLKALQDKDVKVRMPILERVAGNIEREMENEIDLIWEKNHENSQQSYVYSSPYVESAPASLGGSITYAFGKIFGTKKSATGAASPEEPGTEIAITEGTADISPFLDKVEVKPLEEPEPPAGSQEENLGGIPMTPSGSSPPEPQEGDLGGIPMIPSAEVPAPPSVNVAEASEKEKIKALTPRGRSLLQFQQWVANYPKSPRTLGKFGTIIPLLEGLLNSKSAEEQIYAAQILYALGKKEPALSVLHQNVDLAYQEKTESAEKTDAVETAQAERLLALRALASVVPRLRSPGERLAIRKKLLGLAKSREEWQVLLEFAAIPLDPEVLTMLWLWYPDGPKFAQNEEADGAEADGAEADEEAEKKEEPPPETYQREALARLLIVASIPPAYGEHLISPSPLLNFPKEYSRTLVEKYIAKEGNESQRMLALFLLATYKRDEAKKLALAWSSDTTLSQWAHDDLFRLRLYLEHSTQGIAFVANQLQRSDIPEKQKGMALDYLVTGSLTNDIVTIPRYPASSIFSAISDTNNPDTWNSDNFTPMVNRSIRLDNRVIVPQVLSELTADHCRALLASKDKKIAAQAGYVLSLYGEKEGLVPLLAYWNELREKGETYSLSDLTKLVYRAIAFLNANEHISTLSHIYEKHNDYNVRREDFYWTIRLMDSDAALALRKKIRDDAGGIDRL